MLYNYAEKQSHIPEKTNQSNVPELTHDQLTWTKSSIKSSKLKKNQFTTPITKNK